MDTPAQTPAPNPAPVQQPAPAVSQTPPSVTPPAPKKGSHKTGLIILGVTLIIILCTFIGFVMGNGGINFSLPKMEKKETAKNSPEGTPNPTVGTQMVLATPALGLTSTEFQRVLSFNCKKVVEETYEIPLSSLPLTINKKTLSRELKDPASCRYNSKTNSWWVELNFVDGKFQDIIEIYDKVSVVPDEHGARPFTFGEERKYNPNMSYTIYLATTDYVPPIEQQPVAMRMVRELPLTNTETVYMRSFAQLIPPGDERVMEILEKYKSAEPTGPGMKEHYDSTKREEIENDIYQTLFANVSALQEPEKTNLGNVVTVLNAFSLK